MQNNYKTRRDSESYMTELVLPNDANTLGNLLGGRLLHWYDIAGVLAASRHAESLVATVTVDAVNFKYPVKIGNIVNFKSYVTWTGTTSIEVAVEIHIENPYSGERKFVHKGYIVFVSLDENGKKTSIIPYKPETIDEIAEFEDGAKRQSRRIEEAAQ